jgi:hypothetical protein
MPRSLAKYLAIVLCRVRIQCFSNCDELRDVDLALMALDHAHH